MKGAFGNEGALRSSGGNNPSFPRGKTFRNVMDLICRYDYRSDIALNVDQGIRGIAGYGMKLPLDHPRPTGWGAVPGSGVRF